MWAQGEGARAVPFGFAGLQRPPLRLAAVAGTCPHVPTQMMLAQRPRGNCSCPNVLCKETVKALIRQLCAHYRWECDVLNEQILSGGVVWPRATVRTGREWLSL